MLSTEQKQIILFLEKFKPWSYTKISKLKQCPYLFYQTEMNKVREETEGIRSINAMHGSIMHEFLEDVYRKKCTINEFFGYINNKKIPESIKLQILSRYDSVLKIYNLINKKIGQLIRKDQTLKRVRLTPEYKLTLNDRFESSTSDIFFKAIIDIIAKDEDNIIIIDHKSTVSDPNKFKEQLIFYGLLCSYKFNNIKNVYGYVSDLKEGKLHNVYKLTAKELRTNYRREFLMDLENSIQIISDCNPESFLPNKSKKCRWCFLKEKCPLYEN